MRFTKILFACCLLTSFLQGHAQERGSGNFRQFTLSLQPSYNRQLETLTLQHFEAAYGWSLRKNRMLEIGLDNISATTQHIYWFNQQRLEDPTKIIHRSLGLNAAHYKFLGPTNARLQPYLATGWASVLSYNTRLPGTLSNGTQPSYPSKNVLWVNRLLLSPGVQYSFGALLVKLEVPLTIVQAESSYMKIENPAIPRHSQKQSTFTTHYFPFETIALELGVAYRIPR